MKANEAWTSTAAPRACRSLLEHWKASRPTRQGLCACVVSGRAWRATRTRKAGKPCRTGRPKRPASGCARPEGQARSEGLDRVGDRPLPGPAQRARLLEILFGEDATAQAAATRVIPGAFLRPSRDHMASRDRTDMRKATLPAPRRKNRPRVAVYLRVSTAQQLEGYGLEVQESLCRTRLDGIFKSGYDVMVFTDGAVSGKLASRPNLDEMNRQISAGTFDAVIFGKLDRIGRTIKDIHRWVYDTQDRGVRVLTADNRLDSDDDMFGIMMSLLAFMAELEHTLILERTLGGRDRKLTEGGWPSGGTPFGLALQGKGKDAVAVLHEDEVQVINRAVTLFLDDGHSKEETARRLNEAKGRRRSGKEWDCASVDRLLSGSHLLEGKVYFRKTDGTTKTKLDEDGAPLYGPTVALPVPRILSEDRAGALAKALKDRAREKRVSDKYPLSRHILGSCGKTYVGNERPDGTRMYRCQGATHATPCGDSYLEAEAVEKDVWGRLEAFLEEPERLRQPAEEWAESLPGNQVAYIERAESLRRQVDERQGALKNAFKNAAVLGLDEEAVREATDELNTDLAALRSALAETEAWLAEYDPAQVRAKDMVELIGKAKGRMHTLDLDKQAEVFDMFGIEVIPEEHRFARRSGRRCSVTAWHLESSTPVPDDPDDTAWGQVQDVLLDVDPDLLKGRYDLREALRAMLHRLRSGATWEELDGTFGVSRASLKRAQGLWFNTGAWELMMPVLLARGEGTPAYQEPVIPQLKVRGRITQDLFTNPLPIGGPSRPQ
ncbi:recombinase family protein [Streptomyces sp. NPDC002698]|uniref:recombinase family protein n=1 Tax=Streptomyces sp. NPDC002698 TaxID=3364660 RepID=UPI00367865B5